MFNLTLIQNMAIVDVAYHGCKIKETSTIRTLAHRIKRQLLRQKVEALVKQLRHLIPHHLSRHGQAVVRQASQAPL